MRAAWLMRNFHSLCPSHYLSGWPRRRSGARARTRRPEPWRTVAGSVPNLQPADGGLNALINHFSIHGKTNSGNFWRRRGGHERRPRAGRARLCRGRVRAPAGVRGRQGPQHPGAGHGHARAPGPAGRARLPVFPRLLPPHHRYDEAHSLSRQPPGRVRQPGDDHPDAAGPRRQKAHRGPGELPQVGGRPAGAARRAADVGHGADRRGQGTVRGAGVAADKQLV